MGATAVSPEFARWINPVLRALRELGGSARPREVVELVAKNERVSDEALDQLNPAGGQRFPNQVHWARFYLAENGYIDRSKRGVWKLTELGAAAAPISDEVIAGLIEFVQRRGRRVVGSNNDPLVDQVVAEISLSSEGGLGRTPVPDTDGASPDEGQDGYQVALLKELRGLSAAGFERLCQRLLREAGFEQVVVTGRSGDGGIDGHGVLALNAFVSFRVLFQCKRYSGTVSPAQVRDFRGAMQGRADKGLILTTGLFTAEARREAGRDGAPPIELIDGEKLIDLFAKLELGLIPVTTYELDDSFFAEYR